MRLHRLGYWVHSFQIKVSATEFFGRNTGRIENDAGLPVRHFHFHGYRLYHVPFRGITAMEAKPPMNDPLDPFADLSWYRLRVFVRRTAVSDVRRTHPFSAIEAVVKTVSAAVETDVDRPDVFFLLPDGTVADERGAIAIDILFVRSSPAFAETWREALLLYLGDGSLGETGFSVVEAGRVEARTLADIRRETGWDKDSGELCLDVLTPLPFRRIPGKPRTFLDTAGLANLLTRRFSRLFGCEIAYDPGDDDVRTLPYYWHYREIRHRSRSQKGAMQYVNGCEGPLYLRGRFGSLAPLLLLGSELGAGAKLSNGRGSYRILQDAPAFFATRLGNPKMIATALDEVLERHDDRIEELASATGLPFQRAAVAERIAAALSSGSYVFSPNRAFCVRKQDGSARLVERLSVTDHIVSRHLSQFLAPVVESASDEASIGFRTGVTRFRGVEMFRQAVADGYGYVAESDVENFSLRSGTTGSKRGFAISCRRRMRRFSISSSPPSVRDTSSTVRKRRASAVFRKGARCRRPCVTCFWIASTSG